MKNKPIHKTVIFTGYNCNNNCVFCMEQGKRKIPDTSTKQVLTDIALAKQRGSEYLELIGGECTIRDDIFTILRFAKKLKFKTIMMATNGRMFQYKDFAKEILKSGLNCIVFSIHGHNAGLHDKLTSSKGSFNQLVRGMENIKSLGIKNISSNTTIVNPNYKYLPDIAALLSNFKIGSAEFIFVDSNEGGAYNNFKKLVPKISAAAPFMRKVLKFAKENSYENWTMRYVPLCYFPDYLDNISELREVKNFHTEHIAPDFKNFNVSKSRKSAARVKAAVCKQCSLNSICEGIWTHYAKCYGVSELCPI